MKKEAPKKCKGLKKMTSNKKRGIPKNASGSKDLRWKKRPPKCKGLKKTSDEKRGTPKMQGAQKNSDGKRGFALNE
jgi:hypothetical protein